VVNLYGGPLSILCRLVKWSQRLHCDT
jgi:hypothetical protein